MSGEVPYNDLNLANSTGEAQLRQRVRAEAQRLCGLGNEPSVVAQQNRRTCYDSMMRSAQPQMADAIKRAKAGG